MASTVDANPSPTPAVSTTTAEAASGHHHHTAIHTHAAHASVMLTTFRLHPATTLPNTAAATPLPAWRRGSASSTDVHTHSTMSIRPAKQVAVTAGVNGRGCLGGCTAAATTATVADKDTTTRAGMERCKWPESDTATM